MPPTRSPGSIESISQQHISSKAEMEMIENYAGASSMFRRASGTSARHRMWTLARDLPRACRLVRHIEDHREAREGVCPRRDQRQGLRARLPETHSPVQGAVGLHTRHGGPRRPLRQGLGTADRAAPAACPSQPSAAVLSLTDASAPPRPRPRPRPRSARRCPTWSGSWRRTTCSVPWPPGG